MMGTVLLKFSKTFYFRCYPLKKQITCVCREFDKEESEHHLQPLFQNIETKKISDGSSLYDDWYGFYDFPKKNLSDAPLQGNRKRKHKLHL